MIRVKGQRGLQKKVLRVTVITPTGKEVPVATAEVDSLLLDKRKRKRSKKYVELFRFGKYPYIALTKHVITGKTSFVIRAGNHHYWIPLDKCDEIKFLAYFLYSNTLEYKSTLESDDFLKISYPKELIKHLRRKVTVAKAAYKKHLKAVGKYGFKN
jgi:hypothetical protein